MIYTALLAFPISTFSLSVLTDAAYLATSNLLWLHFSEWLLLAGIVFGILAALFLAALALARRTMPPWLYLLGGAAVLVLAAVNSFVHTADGWTAVMPYGLGLSVATVLAMIVTGWFGARERVHG